MTDNILEWLAAVAIPKKLSLMGKTRQRILPPKGYSE
jgi:hypothetical protein